MEHARQFQRKLNGDEETSKQIEELNQLNKTGDLDKIKQHPLEIEAENNKAKLESELSGNDTNGQRYRDSQSGNDGKLSQKGFNESLDENGRAIERGSREEGLGRDTSEISGNGKQNTGEVQGSSTAD